MRTVKWAMSIGFPGAIREGEAEVDDADFDELTKEEQDKIINEAIWEEAMQYVDVWQVYERGRK